MLRSIAFRPSMMALSVAMALVAPLAQAASFDGVIKGGGSTLNISAADMSISGYAPTSASQGSSYSGYVASGTSRVSSVSDGTVATTIETTLTFRQSVVNPFASTQAVSFDFNIPRSRTIIDLGTGTNIQTFSAASSFMGTISWGGVVLWSVAYGVEGSGSVAAGGGLMQASAPVRSASASGFTTEAINIDPVYVSSGTSSSCVYDNGGWNCNDAEFSGLAGSGSVSSDPYQGTLDMGTMAGNEQKELVYTLTASASFEATYRDSSASGAYGYGGYAQAGGYDPFGIEFTPNDDGTALKLGFAVPTAPVPEPQTYALMLGGLAVLASRLRRRPVPPAQSVKTTARAEFNGATSG